MGSVGAWVRGCMGGVGQTLVWVTWVAWVCKILAWVKKMSWVAWVEISVWVAWVHKSLARVKKMAWVTWVHKTGVSPNFGIGQKNGLCQNKMESVKINIQVFMVSMRDGDGGQEGVTAPLPPFFKTLKSALLN